jgi:hypothetical protein
MRILNVPRITVLAASVALAALIAPVVVPSPGVAQTMTNVVPDGGSGSIRGKIQSVNHEARTVAIIPAAGGPARTFHVAPGVDIAGYMAGVDVSAHFTRSVHVSVNPPGTGTAAPAAPGATATAGQVARTPGGFGDGASDVQATVVRVNPPSEFVVVNRTGGGEYTVRSTVPSRQAVIKTLKPGDVINISVGELTLTSIIACGLLGCL